jgi:signal transduction histidine kinase
VSTAVEVARPARRRPLRHRTSTDAPRWTLTRVFALGSALAALVAVAAVAAGGLALLQLNDARARLLDVAAPAVLAGEALSVALLDQETGVQGFGLTGRDEFLDPYRTGVEAQRAATAELRRLGAAPPEVDAVEAAVRDWRAGWADGVLAAPASIDAGTGKALFDRVRTELDALTARLDEARLAARAALERAAGALFGVGVGIAAVLAAFLLAAALGLRRGVLRPVSDLAAQVREVVSGDVQHRVRAGGPREIVELGRDVEAMRVHILRDLDAVQESNRRLDEQAQELERSNRDLEQFAYVASHDLQEPLRKVSSFCQLLQRRYGGQLDERADQYIAFAVDGASRMQQLINDLLAFSRVGRTTEGFEPVDLTAVAAAAAQQLDGVREEAGGEIVVEDLPTVSGDPSLLRQLLVNLIGNGLKFHRDGVPPVVRVTAERDGDAFAVTVADNGIGIEDAYAEKVFVIFQRLHGRDRYPGTGIGLALAKKIVEFHGGRIGLAATDGPGAAVRFTLPAPAPEENA